MSEPVKVLLVEDDPVLNRNIRDALVQEGMEVEPVTDGVAASVLLQNTPWNVVVLDVNLPGKNGFEVCREFRLRNTRTPVLILTAFNDLDDKVEGFRCGADDYLTKPFFMQELVLRIRALIKRSRNDDNEASLSTLEADGLVIDKVAKTAQRNGVDILLTPREYQILVRLIEAEGAPVSKKELIREIWGSAIDANTNTIEVYINFLRNKVDRPFGKESIKTKIGYGYFFSGA
jgi:DNA-binding response OmpR family regulator